MLEISYIFISGLKKKERFLSLCVNNSLSSYAGQLAPKSRNPYDRSVSQKFFYHPSSSDTRPLADQQRKCQKDSFLKKLGLISCWIVLTPWTDEFLKYCAPFSLLLRLLTEAIMILTDLANLNSLERTYPATRVNLAWNKPATLRQALYPFNNGRVGQGSWFSPS